MDCSLKKISLVAIISLVSLISSISHAQVPPSSYSVIADPYPQIVNAWQAAPITSGPYFYNYWVTPIYPQGEEGLSNPVAIHYTSVPLTVCWNLVPGAIGYNVYRKNANAPDSNSLVSPSPFPPTQSCFKDSNNSTISHTPPSANLPYTYTFASGSSNVPFASTISSISDAGGQVFNVEAYGAKGDGVTDDTAAFQAAILAACGTKQGTVLIPPQANLMLSATIQINAVGGPTCRITGGGTISWKFKTPTKVNAGLSCHAVCEIDHLTFDGTNDGGPQIYLSGGSHDSRIHDNTFENDEFGSIYVTNLFDNSNPPPTRITIDHNHALNNEAGGTGQSIFDFQGGNGCSYLSITDNVSIGDGLYFIGIDGCSHDIVARNSMQQGADGFGGSIQIEATSAAVTDVLVQGNSVLNPNAINGYALEGIHLVSAGNSSNYVLSNVRVIGNSFQGTPGGPITVQYVSTNNASDVLIEGNWVQPKTASPDGIFVFSNNLVVLGNVVRSSSGIAVTCTTNCVNTNNAVN